MKRFYAVFVFMLIGLSTAFAQKSSKDKITIHTKNGEKDLEEVLEDFGIRIERAAEKLADGIEAKLDDDSFHFSIDWDFDDFEDFGENLGKSIEDMVNNMDIELKDIDPEDLEDSQFEINGYKGRTGKEFLEEIEEEYNSPVEIVEKMNVRIREDKVLIDMRMRLKDGQIVEKQLKEPRKRSYRSERHPD